MLLKENGFNVYSIGQHEGICNEPYVVIGENGQFPFSKPQIVYSIVDIMLFYPIGKYTEFSDFVEAVRECLKQIRELKNMCEMSAIVIDHELKAYTQTIKYQVYKRRA